MFSRRGFVSAIRFINLSFFICQAAGDLSNILGYSLKSLLANIVNSDAAIIVAGSAATGSRRCGGHRAYHDLLHPGYPSGVNVLLIVLAPFAFAAYLLPNTDQWFTKWRKTFVALLMVFPVIGVVYGASTLVSDVVGGLYTRTDNEEQRIRELPAGTIGRCESTHRGGNPQRVDEGCRSWRKRAPGPGQVPARRNSRSRSASESISGRMLP